jgi:glycosyltransferase involved in cell wall biosynthesis
MACGTPVAAFDRGALPELVTPEAGRLARPDDVEDLARAIRAAARCDRADVRRRAVEHCSINVMVDGYEALYRQLR